MGSLGRPARLRRGRSVANRDVGYRNISNHTHLAMMIIRAGRNVRILAVTRPGLSPAKAIKHYTWYYRCVERVADDVVLEDLRR